MPYSPERIMELSGELQKDETREKARKELADLLALTVGFEIYSWGARGEIEDILAQIPVERRRKFLDELQEISKEVGWQVATEVLEGELNLAPELKKEVGLQPDVELYPHTVRHPENIHELKDFFNPEGDPTHYWIPRRFDIQRYVHVARLAHERANRTGPVRILDVGGGSGFIGKLLADEARRQGLDVEVVVVDPDKKTVAEAQGEFSDDSNLFFDVGSAADAVLKYGPELSVEGKGRFTELERQRVELVERGREELKRIKATANALEASTDPSDVILGPFGDQASRVMFDAGIDVQHLGDAKSVRNAVAEHYNTRFKNLNSEIAKIRDEQEHIFAKADPETAKFDAVLNSWMPLGIDFTREIRWLSAPAIIYARERGGATGVDYAGGEPNDLGKESSYETGNFYDSDWDLSWEGLATSRVRDATGGSERYGYTGGVSNLSEIQTRKGISIDEKDLARLPKIADDEKYSWETSLETYVGKQRVDKLSFYASKA